MESYANCMATLIFIEIYSENQPRSPFPLFCSPPLPLGKERRHVLDSQRDCLLGVQIDFGAVGEHPCQLRQARPGVPSLSPRTRVLVLSSSASGLEGR